MDLLLYFKLIKVEKVLARTSEKNLFISTADELTNRSVGRCCWRGFGQVNM